MTFDAALATWRQEALHAVEARMVADVAEARALLEAKGSSAEVRRAEALVATSDERREAMRAALEARVHLHRVLHLRGTKCEADELEDDDAN